MGAGRMAGKADLLGGQGLDRKGREDHVFDAEAGIDCVEPLLEERCEVARLAAGAGGAEADPLDPTVDAVEGEIEPPRSSPSPRQALDEIRGKPLRRKHQIGGPGNRLGKAQPHPAARRFAERRQWLRQIVERLIEPLRHGLAETAGQRIARHRIQIADPLQPDPPQPLGRGRVEAEGFHRQRSEGGAYLTRRQNDGVAARFRKAGHGIRGADGIGNGNAAGDTPAVEPGRQIGGERFFPAPEMGRAGDFDPHPVHPVGSSPRAVTAAPFRQPPERSGILRGLRRSGGEAGQK